MTTRRELLNTMARSFLLGGVALGIVRLSRQPGNKEKERHFSPFSKSCEGRSKCDQCLNRKKCCGRYLFSLGEPKK